MSDFDFTKTESFRLLQEFKAVIDDCMVIDNSMLPEKYQDKVRGGRTISRLEKMCDKRDGITKHKKLKALKATNIEIYAQQVADGGSILYNGNVDEDQQYKNEITMVSAMISGGIIDADDFDDLED
jgi:hypothetical protein